VNRVAFPVALLALALPSAGLAQGPSLADVAEYEGWLEAYSRGQVRLLKRGRLDRRADRKLRELFQKIASGHDMVAARRLWQAAVIQLPKDIDKHDRLAALPGKVRGQAKKLLASIDDDGVDPWLIKLATQRGGKAGNRYRVTAIEVLGLRERPATGQLLAKNLAKFQIPERIQAILALERTGSFTTLPVLVKALGGREPNLRIAATQAITGILAPFSDKTHAANTNGGGDAAKWVPIVVDEFQKVMLRDKVWQVRSAICDGLMRLKTPRVIPVLIAGLKRELHLGKWSNRMVAIAFHDALEQLTGKDLPQDAPHLWSDFWAKEGPGFRFATVNKGAKPQKSVDAKYAKYFNVDIKTKRLLFVIDFSGSMSEKVRLVGRYAGGNQRVKYELVKKELEKVIRALPRDAICNVIFFNDRVGVWRRDAEGRPELVKMTDGNKADLLQYVWETAPSGATNLHGALKMALTLGERGVYDKHYNVSYDTVFVLSDGAPSAGEITDPIQILEEVRKGNRLRRLKIHTVVFGNARNNLKFMKGLAEENGGHFMQVR
jgi:hypothetical protein